jgi:hypothetical protein
MVKPLSLCSKSAANAAASAIHLIPRNVTSFVGHKIQVFHLVEDALIKVLNKLFHKKEAMKSILSIYANRLYSVYHINWHIRKRLISSFHLCDLSQDLFLYRDSAL